MNDEIIDKKELFNRIIRNLVILQEMTKESVEVEDLPKETQTALEASAMETSNYMNLFRQAFGVNDQNLINITEFLNKSMDNTETDFPLPVYID